MMKPMYVLLLLIAAWPLTHAVAAEPVCGSEYDVEPGDSLSQIAAEVYGRASIYQVILDFNPGAVEDPNLIEVGLRLYLPCLDNVGAIPDSLPDLPPARVSGSRLRVLTGSKYPPYVDKDLPNGGFSAELVERALLANDGRTNFRVDSIDDWSSHLVPLLSDGAYDVAFPWFQPDCSARDNLGADSLWRCDNLLFSETLHDVVVTFYAKPELAQNVKQAKDLEGMRVCRPRGYFTFDLEAAGLVPPLIERIVADDPQDCFQMVADGEVDVVTVNADTSDRMLDALELRGELKELIALATVQSLHVVAMRDDPNARVNLLRINQGLTAMKSDGTFRKVARVHLRQ